MIRKIFLLLFQATICLAMDRTHIDDHKISLLSSYLIAANDLGQTPLHTAILTNNISAVDLLIKLESPLEITDKTGLTPLALAVQHSREATILLLNAGAKFDAVFGPDNNSLIHLAIASSQSTEEILKIVMILKKVININKKNTRGYTPLTMAVMNRIELIQGLVDLGVDVNIGTPMALHYAAKYQPLAILPLYKNGAKLEVQDFHGATPLFWALENAESAKILKELGASKENARERKLKEKETFHSMVKQAETLEQLDELEEFLESLVLVDISKRKCDEMINRKGNEDRTPLHDVAQYNQNPAVLRLLFKYALHLQPLDFYGACPLHYAALRNTKEVIQTLVKAGASIEARDRCGATPLHYAVTGRNIDAIAALIEAGADINASTLAGETPLDIAEQLSVEIECFLIMHGAKVKQSKHQHKTE